MLYNKFRKRVIVLIKPFFPQLLPVNISVEQHLKLMRKVVETTRILGDLKSKIDSIPTQLFTSFSLMESVQSTRIEGTQATFDDVMEADVTQKTSFDIVEVRNYFNAINYGMEYVIRDDNPITSRLIRELHSIVLKNSRGSNRAPGEFRRTQNWIGSDPHNMKTASYVPPIASEVPGLISNLEKFINENNDYDPLIAAGIIHAQFETIHPFLDGNGRVGRLLIILFLLKKNVCGDQPIFVSEELEKNKYKYYSLLNDLRNDKPNWYDWLTFFLDSVARQSEKYLSRATRVEELILKYVNIDEVKASGTAISILYACFAEPITNSSKIAKKTGKSINTVNRWLKYFVEIKMLYTDDKKRHKVYRFYELLDILRG